MLWRLNDRPHRGRVLTEKHEASPIRCHTCRRHHQVAENGFRPRLAAGLTASLPAVGTNVHRVAAGRWSLATATAL